jgi:hypothetical protein
MWTLTINLYKDLNTFKQIITVDVNKLRVRELMCKRSLVNKIQFECKIFHKLNLIFRAVYILYSVLGITRYHNGKKLSTFRRRTADLEGGS